MGLLLQNLFGCISSSNQGTFTKLHFYYQSGPIANNAFMFVHDQTVTEGTLLVEQETLLAVFLLPFKGST